LSYLKPDAREEKARKRRLREASQQWERLQVARGKRLFSHFVAPQSRSVFLYVIVSERGHVKVGFSNDVEKRRAALQGASAAGLTVYAREAIDCLYPREAEGMAHKLLERYRLRGEWFDCHPEMALAAVKKAAWLAEDGG
jgi:hypothetical protein